MTSSPLKITHQTLRRFTLGKQGLWPGRRWRGKPGVKQSLAENCVVQIDPLTIIARSHDIALWGRVLDYTQNDLLEALYIDRAGFDYGGTVMVHAMEQLPYYRVVMARNAERRAYLGERNPAALAEVLAALAERGPLGNRDFTSAPGEKQYWHAAKASAQALYYLWLKGDVMTHSRRNFQRLFDLTRRVAPPQHQWAASVEEAEAFFGVQAFNEMGTRTLKNWRAWMIGNLERKMAVDEAGARLGELIRSGRVLQLALEGEKEARYALAEDIPQLEALQNGRLPAGWEPLETSTEEECTFLAPLEIVSARGRALPLFGFEYLWEVYKPVEKRRWGYYVLPVLFGDRLVARFDSAVDRKRRALVMKGFWLEPGVALDGAFRQALKKGFERFLPLAGAEVVEGLNI